MHRKISIAVTIPILLATSSAIAQPNQPEVVGQVGVSVDENTTELGRLHVTGLAGYQLDSAQGSVVLTGSATFQLLNRVFVRGAATLGLTNEHKPLRLEGGVMLFFKNKLQVEKERVDLDVKDGKVTYVDIPVLNRNRAGLIGNLMVVRGAEKYDVGTLSRTETTNALVAAVGIGAVGSTGFVSTVEGYGRKSSFRMNSGGLEALIDLSRSYDMSPTEKGSRYGGRLWAETMWFQHVGIAARVELAKYPAFQGWVLLASAGIGIHLL